MRVVWNGTLHREDEDAYALLDPDGRVQRINVLAQSSPGASDLPTTREAKAWEAPPSDMPFNNRDPLHPSAIALEKRRRGRPHGSKDTVKRGPKPPQPTHCLTCARELSANQQRNRLTRCDPCRKANPGIVCRRPSR